MRAKKTRHPAPGGGACRAVVRGLRAASVAGLAAYALYATGVLHHGPAIDAIFDDGLFNALMAAGALLCLLRAAAGPHERGTWLILATGLGAWAAGGIIFTADPATVLEHGFPSVPDLLWLVFYPAGFLALGLLVRRRTRQFYASLWLDGVVGALLTGALAAQFLLPPIVEGTGGSVEAVVANLIYPLGDVLLVAFVVAAFAATAWRPGRVLGVVGAGFALGACADGISLYAAATGREAPGLFDVLWPASAVILGWAAWQPTRRTARVILEGHRLLVVPVLFAAGAVALLAAGFEGTVRPVAYVLAVATLAGVILRMGLTFSENLAAVHTSRREALTDALTGLGNRRRLLLDLDDTFEMVKEGERFALVLFDLNGFKGYNDAYGHPAGDALLTRLATRLRETVGDGAAAYRLGGDEFCVLAPAEPVSPPMLAARAAAALSEQGDGFAVTSARGTVVLPDEAQDTSAAIALADQRLYADKGMGRSTDGDATRSVLLQILREREGRLYQHLCGVAALAREVGLDLGLEPGELELVVRAAELHDVGKVVMPDAILRKRAALDAGERAIIQQHSEIGERILTHAPALRPVARIVRASHERWDGTGYPDGLAGEQIPLAARIVAVCDAYEAMTSERPHQSRSGAARAVAELERGAGTQFDPRVVAAVAERVSRSESRRAAA